MRSQEFRSPSILETEVVMKLTTALPTEAAKALAEQMGSAQVKVVDQYGSLTFLSAEGLSEIHESRPIVSAQQKDDDSVDPLGPYINILLFVNEGRLAELQIYKDDGRPIKTNIDPKSFILM